MTVRTTCFSTERSEMSELEKVIVAKLDEKFGPGSLVDHFTGPDGLPVMSPAQADDVAKVAARAVTEHLAHRIRAELVCCDIFERTKGDVNVIGRAVLRADWHDQCYWGDAAARLVEEEGKA